MNSEVLVKKILILSANPKDTLLLRLEEERREIEEGLQLAKERDRFTIKSAGAVRYRDIHRAIINFAPQIVHFSGHGAGEKGLVFEDETGKQKQVDAEALAGLFELFSEHIECVLLNACYSEIQAKAIAQHIDYVIGMSQEIEDRAAIEFAVGFYDALGAGKSVEFAYQLGCRVIRLAGIPDALVPKLITKKQLWTESPKKTVLFSNDEFRAERVGDNISLEDLLAAEKWKEADQETSRVMLKAVGREKEGWLRVEDMEKFPCQELRNIDQLWIKYSRGHFGFSVQKRIWLDLGGQVDKVTECLLGDRVGWREKYKWLEYSDLTFSLNAPQGHLPARLVGIAQAKLELLSGTGSGEGSVPLCSVPGFSKPLGWVWCWAGLSLFSRIETCTL